MSVLAWGKKVSPDFRARVQAIAQGFDPSFLMACMAFETGRTFSPSVRNATSGATGLIQFMPSTARGLGTTVEELAAMTAEAQLNFVAAYFGPYKGRLKTLSDVYMAILWPKAIGLPEGTIIFPPGSQAFLQNRGLDINHDGAVTKAEAASFVAKLLAEGLLPANASDQPEASVPIAIPLLMQLIPSVISLFSGRAQAAIAEKTGTSPLLAGQFMQSLIQKVGDAVSVPITDDASAIQAVASLHKMADEQAAKIKALENAALDDLHALTEAMQGVVDVRKAEVGIEIDSANAASARSDASEIRQRIDNKVWWAYGVAAAILAIIAIVELVVNKLIDGQIVGALILAFGGLGGAIITMVNYGYGSSGSSGAKDVLIGEMARRQSNGASQ